MLTHERVWAAIDAIAASNSLSVSGLARQAGLDPTTFNKSKRRSADGRSRWPSTESLAKIMSATNTHLDLFSDMVEGRVGKAPETKSVNSALPLLGFAEAGSGGYFDDAGFPAGQGWDEVNIPSTDDESAYALEVSGDSMQPLYRDGDIIIVSPGSTVRKGDRVVVKTRGGEVMAKILQRKTARNIDLQSLNPDHENPSFPLEEIEWMARIIWASQ